MLSNHLVVMAVAPKSYGDHRRHRYSGESTDSGKEQNDELPISEMSDFDLPVVLMDKRHIEKILGTNKASGTWRMKERVSHLMCNL